jgi:serine/threonine protein kinase
LASKIGAGGMGEVYKARDTRLDRTVAIKVLTAHLADDPHARERFQREARAVAALNHPHICTLHDVGSQDPSTGSGQAMDFLVMEYLDGETLAERLAKGPLPLDRALQYAIQIAGALDKAHRQGIKHRDLKPGNVMLTTVGTKLLDFGAGEAATGGRSGRRDGRRTTRQPVPDGTGHDPWHAAVHGARATRREARGRAHGHLRLWRPALRDAHRQDSVRGDESGEPHLGDPVVRPTADRVAATSQSTRIGSRRQDVSGERPRRAVQSAHDLTAS